MAIICVTPNPAIDRTLIVDSFAVDGVFRTSRVITAAGGKGFNVARTLHTLGVTPVCAGFAGGDTGHMLQRLTEREGIRARWTEISGDTRICTIIGAESDRTAAVVNERGPAVTAAEWERFSADVLDLMKPGDTIAFCGSVPPQSPQAAYAELLEAAAQRGTVWVDTSGASLRTALGCEARLNIKINRDEAMAITESQGDSLALARQLQARCGGWLILTDGTRDIHGVHGDVALRVVPPEVESVSPVGSGDAFLAGLLAAPDGDAALALRMGCAAGAANATMYGGGAFALETYERLLAQITVEML